MKRNAQESISSSSAHNICIDHSNICFQRLACGEIPLTFCLQASHYLAFLLKTSPATKSVVSGLYQGVFQLEAQMEETRLSPILRQGFSHHSLGNNMATSCPSEPCPTCCRTPGSRSEEPSRVLTGMSSS